jgi:thiosulfate dehydrogenase [quinone] large subunit
VSDDNLNLSNLQKTVLVVLRFAIGWHFFYQGFGKVISPLWTSESYLKASWGPFLKIAEIPWMLAVADFTMIVGLLVIGLLLMLGLFTEWAAVGGALLLGLIYLAVPPLDYTGFVMSTLQGSELYVDKNLIEILALITVASFPTGHIMGLDILVSHWRRNRS